MGEAGPPRELINNLPEKYREAVVVTGSDTGRRIEVRVEPVDVPAVLVAAKKSGYNHFLGITVIDYPFRKTMELVYLVSSIERGGEMLAVRTELPRDNPVIDTVSDIYPLAYYQEIEAYEFFGVRFNGHDGLRKWILEDNWEGPPPLRKDVDTRKFVLEEYYGGKRYERPVQWRSLGGYSGPVGAEKSGKGEKQ